MTPVTSAEYPRHFMARIIFAWLFLILAWFFVHHTLWSQWEQPVLKAPLSDNSFWLLHILGIPQWINTHYWAALGFDLLITISCLICVFVPAQRWFTAITVAGVWLLYIGYCTSAGKHYAQIGYLLPPMAFLALHPKKFDLSWTLVRYWICLLYGSAGVFKLYYGGFAGADNMSHILTEANAGWLQYAGGGMQEGMIRTLIEKPSLAQTLYRIATIVDLSLCIGLFTRRYDRWLLAALVGFHTANFLLLHISFLEQSLIFAPFLPWTRWATYVQTIKEND
jgi:hypothetical protein